MNVVSMYVYMTSTFFLIALIMILLVLTYLKVNIVISFLVGVIMGYIVFGIEENKAQLRKFKAYIKTRLEMKTK